MTTSETKIIQEQTTQRITNRGLGAYELVEIVLKEQAKALTLKQIKQLTGYGIDSIKKAAKALVKNCVICYEETVPRKKLWGSFRFFILPEEGLGIKRTKRRAGTRGSGGHYIKKIIPTENKSMILETTDGYSWEVEWLKCPIARSMKIQVSTFISDQERTKAIGVILHICLKDLLEEYYHYSTIRAKFTEEI